MKWKADLPKMPRLPKVLAEPGDPAADALGPPPAPSAYRAKNPADSKPAEYQPPSLLVEHRRLALVFLATAIGVAVYCWRAPRAAHRVDAAAPVAASNPTGDATRPASAAQAQSPIYVETVPDK